MKRTTIKKVTAYKSGRQNISRYLVIRISDNGRYREFNYTNADLPKTIKDFMATHSFEKINDNKMIFR